MKKILNKTTMKEIGLYIILPLILTTLILINIDEVFALELNLSPPIPTILPGDFFYPAKIWYEDTQENAWSYFDSTIATQLAGQHAAERLREVAELEKQNRPVPIEVSIRYEEKLLKAERLIAHVKSNVAPGDATKHQLIATLEMGINLLKNHGDIIKIREIYSSHSECKDLNPGKDKAECFERLDVEINALKSVQEGCIARIGSAQLDNNQVSYDKLRENCPGIPTVPEKAYRILYGVM